MRTIQISYPLSTDHCEFPEVVAAIGFFDGIHKGHQKVIGKAVDRANELGLLSAVISFHPHPSAILNAKSREVRYITPFEEKKRILESMGVDNFYVIEFTKELSALSPEQFISDYIGGLNVQELIAGYDFTYGKKGAGNMRELTKRQDLPFSVDMISEQQEDGEKISSTRIRKLLSEGMMEKANDLLGRPFVISGTVIHGSKRGRELGWRTANMFVENDVLLPRKGVYAVKVLYADKTFYGMASLGYNPTFQYDNPDIRMEVHIFDFQKEIYGEQITVEWHRYIRDEMKFSNIDELIARIAEDEEIIRAYFAKK
ncbi:bifunctional riboflavin kinase/FAD synthetase [Aciduricibacillus chroicocephali]|uniref:Riboflavin biosynthesis protein n=1 Tax=Aciduricibacillus chroicocephali TaxID=3054939 RepID=A0ABY9KYT5_9BACI|nr:bifunctional riboflavin kinase/FAD synthetase [Bacillaceae bacterium 44XB]